MNQQEKREGAQSGWHLRETTYPYKDPHLQLRCDRVAVEGAEEITFTYDERPAGVIVVPLTMDSRIVLLWQYRYTVDTWCWEVPAGGTHDTGDAPLEDVARKELHEEIGGVCESITPVGTFFSSPGVTNERCHVFLARGVTLSDKPEQEGTESIEIHPMPVAEAVHKARAGQIETGPSALALLLCEPFIL